MNLRLHRKLQSCPYPSGLRFRKQQPWHAMNLTRKQKGRFLRNRLFFSTEAQRRFSRSFLYRQFPNKVSNTKAISPYLSGSTSTFQFFLTSPLWMFQNPTLVPGTLKVRRLKSLFVRYQTSNRILSVWLSKVRQSWLSRIYRELLFNRKGSSWNLIQALDSYSTSLVFKLGWASSLSHGQTVLKHQKVNHNYKSAGQTNSVLSCPGDSLVGIHTSVYSFLKPFHSSLLQNYRI